MDQRELWAAAELAVRAYARDPSERNALNVESALERLRERNASAIWRRMRHQWRERDTATLFQDSKLMGGLAQDNDQDCA